MLVLLFREQAIKQTQIHSVDHHLGDGRRRRLLHQCRHDLRRDGLPRGHQTPQRRFHRDLTLLGRQVQNANVFRVRRRGILRCQRVIGDAEDARGKQVLAIPILSERAGLAHQPVDDVPVVHQVLVPSPESRQLFDELLRVPHFHMFRVQPYVYFLTDQPARHHVAVPLHVNQAALVHSTSQPLTRFQPPRRQGPQHPQFLREPLTPTGVEPHFQFPQKTHVGFAIDKVPAATQHQGLIRRLLKTPVALFDVAILVGVGGLDLLPCESVMLQQSLITLPKLLALRGVVHRQAHTVGPVPRRYAAQLPQSVLQTFAQALEALREADRRRLPVRVAQHEVIDHVLERLPLDRHAQIIHVRKVRCCQPARLMHLGEEYLLGRTRRGSPSADLPLQGP
jgi:hypothetical protein